MNAATPLFAILLLVCSGGPASQASPPTSPPVANAASTYRQASDWWKSSSQGDAPLLSAEEVMLLDSGFEGQVTPEIRAALAKARPYLDLVRQGGLTPTCDFELDKSKGFSLLLPQLSQLRQAARILKLDASVRMLDGDIDGATQALTAIAGFGSHVRNDGLIVSSLVSGAILGAQDDAVDSLLGTGALRPADADALAKSIESLRGPDPIGLQNAVREEGRLARASLETAINGDDQALTRLAGELGFEEIPNPEEILNPEKLHGQLDRMDALYGQFATALANPDRDAAQAAMAEISARVDRGDEGLLAQMLMPSVGRSALAMWKVSDMLDARYRMLDDIRTGKVPASRYANAAIPYLRAGKLVEGMPLERQREIEAARVAGAALDPSALAAARREIAAMRAELRACFVEARDRGRCDFGVARVPRPNLYPTYLLTLRGAVRVLFTDALLPDATTGATTKGEPLTERPNRQGDAPPFTAEEAVVMALRCVNHLAMDPAIGHSFIAASILRETAAVIEEAKRRNLLDAEAVARIAAIADTLDRTGPLGFKAAVERDRERLLMQYSVWGFNDGASQTIRKSDAATIATRVLSVQIAREVWSVPQEEREARLRLLEGDERFAAPLLGFGDLVTLDGLRTIGTQLLVVRERLQESDTRPSVSDVGLDSLPPQPFCDVNVRAAETTALIGALDESLAQKKP